MKKTPAVLTLVLLLSLIVGCDRPVQSVSGTKMATTGKIQLRPDGQTIEQYNIAARMNEDNNPGSIKHVYVISAYSGQVIIYSTAQGKVSSSNKRLTPDKVVGGNSFSLTIDGIRYYTDQLLGEDGTYGSSSEYLYWWDTEGDYHQHYVTGGQIVHISNQPLAVKGIIINMEQKEQEQH